MSKIVSRFTCIVFGLVMLLSASPLYSHSHSLKQIIAFGDSLTDVGNVAGLTVPGAAPLINGYFEETHFSDNIIWIEILSEFLGLPERTPGRGDSTSLPPEPNGNTWAWGGSEAAAGSVQPPGVTEPIPNLLNEVSQYLKAHTPEARTLYTIWSGADNLLIGGNFSPKAARKAVKAVEIAMRRLQVAGADHFLIFNMPQLGDTPEAQAGGEESVIAANIFSAAYNKALNRTIQELNDDPAFTANIFFVDVFSELELAVNTVNAGGTYTPSFFVPGPPVAIDNVTDEALDVFNMTGTFPTNYLFWDDVHPTTQGHQVIAGLVLQSLHRVLDRDLERLVDNDREALQLSGRL